MNTTTTLTLSPEAVLTRRGIMPTDALRHLDGLTVSLPVPFTGEHPHDHGRRTSDHILRTHTRTHPGVTRIDWDHTHRTGYVQVHGREIGTLTTLGAVSYATVVDTALAVAAAS